MEEAERRGSRDPKMSRRSERWSRRIAGAVLPLAVLAGLLALILPSATLAANPDLILAVLVLATALGISPGRFLELRSSWRLVLALSVVPFVVLAPSAWALSRLFANPTREGILALGMAPTEVAAVGLVALAGGDAALALAAVTGSLVVSALAGPLVLATLLAGSGVDAGGGGSGALVASFALVVILPLLVGAAARISVPKLADFEQEFSAGSTLAVAGLVYASLSGVGGEGGLGAALVAPLVGSALFLLLSTVFALAPVLLISSRAYRATVPLVLATRDFAVAAALASKAFGPPAATVAGVYGVLMLVAGAAAASLLSRN